MTQADHNKEQDEMIEESLRDVAVRHSAEDAARARRIKTAMLDAVNPADPTGGSTNDQ